MYDRGETDWCDKGATEESSLVSITTLTASSDLKEGIVQKQTNKQYQNRNKAFQTEEVGDVVYDPGERDWCDKRATEGSSLVSITITITKVVLCTVQVRRIGVTKEQQRDHRSFR